MDRRRLFLTAVICVFCSAFFLGQAAAKFPEKEVRIIVNYGVGGGVDRTGRSIQRFLPEALGVSVLVENHTASNPRLLTA